MSVRYSKLKSWISDHAIALAISSSALLVVFGIVLILKVSQLDHVPSWWERADSIDAQRSSTIEQAEQLENAITTQLTMVRDTQKPQWSVAINQDQANAWLAHRLIDTIVTHQGEGAWPSEIGRVRIGIVNDQLIIGARTSSRSGSVIVWAKLTLELDDQGDLWARMYSIHAGTTKLPLRTLGVFKITKLGASRFRIGSGELELGDGRVSQLIALRVLNERLEVVMETRVQD